MGERRTNDLELCARHRGDSARKISREVAGGAPLCRERDSHRASAGAQLEHLELSNDAGAPDAVGQTELGRVVK